MLYLYPKAEQIIRLHDTILQLSWGLPGILNGWYIESCCDFVQSDQYYPSFEEKLSYIMYSLTMNHCFADGNKRTALSTCAYFIALNYDNDLASRFLREFENIIVQVADAAISKEALLPYLQDFMKRDEISESSLLLLYHDLQKHWLM